MKVAAIFALFAWGVLSLDTFGLLMHEGVENLPLGYRFMYGQGGAIFEKSIYGTPDFLNEHGESSGRMQLGPRVDGYRVYPAAIVGHESGGYFIIDLGTDILQRRLSKKSWLVMLRRYGIVQEPRLFTPSPFDEFLGRNKPQPPYD